MLPEDACHVTALSVVEPTTVAVKEIVPPAVVEVAAGEMETAVTAGPAGGGLGAGVDSEAIVTTADADLVGSATLVAVTVPAAARAGAV
jgi:hypothetical protein